MSFLIDDILRDVHSRDKMTTNSQAVVTTGFPKYCFPPIVVVNYSSCTERDSRCTFAEPPPAKRAKLTRPTFTRQQTDTLKSIFIRRQYIGRGERLKLAAHLNLTDEQIKAWFQNQRTKLKKKLSKVQFENHAKLLHIKDMTKSYHGNSDVQFPVVRRTVDGRLAY